MKGKKRSPWVTAIVNILFIAAIAFIGWKIYKYVSDSNQTTKLADDLWKAAVVTAAPETEKPQAETMTKEPPTETPDPEPPRTEPPQTEPPQTTELPQTGEIRAELNGTGQNETTKQSAEAVQQQAAATEKALQTEVQIESTAALAETMPQLTDTAPQVTEDTLRPTDTAPQVTENTLQPTDTAPQPSENTPQPTNTSQQPSETTPPPAETPAPQAMAAAQDLPEPAVRQSEGTPQAMAAAQDLPEPAVQQSEGTPQAETAAAPAEYAPGTATGPAPVTPKPVPTTTPRFTDAPDVPALMDFEKLKETNSDAAAWLYQPGTEINLPVVHTTDNKFYLKHGFDGASNDAGTLFIDYYNEGDFRERNTFIYGHARKDRHMFGTLLNYMDAEYCEAHPYLYLYIPDHRFRLEIVTVGDTLDGSAFYNLPAGEEWDRMVQEMINKSPYDFGIPLSPEDHYVCLSTCAYDYDDERWIIVARIDDPEHFLPSLTEEP